MASGSDHPGGHGRGAGPAFDTAMREAMDRMMRAMHGAPASGDPDRDFLAMMIPHHQAAIDMARAVLVHGRDPMVRRLAEEIIASQQAEIDGMRGRLAILDRGRDADPGGFPALGGTRGSVSPPGQP
jgi:uncharacterized protein (DUF305 family)